MAEQTVKAPKPNQPKAPRAPRSGGGPGIAMTMTQGGGIGSLGFGAVAN